MACLAVCRFIVISLTENSKLSKLVLSFACDVFCVPYSIQSATYRIKKLQSAPEYEIKSS